MVIDRQRLSVIEFDALIQTPQYADRRLEYIAGEIVDVVSSGRPSQIAGIILAYLNMYLLSTKLGRTTGADGGYSVSGERYMPDVAYVSKERHPGPLPDAGGFMPFAPDLAVEVISPTDKGANIAVKVGNYLAEKTIVWVVYPETESVHIFHPGKSVITLTTGDTLQDDALLPSFSLPIKDIFADQVDE